MLKNSPLTRFRVVFVLALSLLGIDQLGAQVIGPGAARLPRRTVEVSPLFFGTNAEGRAVGSCLPMEITVGGAEPGRVRVGFFDSQVGGSGDMWQSAGWMAVVVAAQLTDFDPRTVQVSFDVQGRIDGPSAGGLMTVGVLAAARGDDVREDAAMTGTINPDGFIGPVGGIAHKIEGAAAAGKKLVLIPAGIRRDFDDNLERPVDLVEKGRSLGVEVRPVLDIYQAYKLLTGNELPRPGRADHPRVPAASNDLLSKRIANWVPLIQKGLQKYNTLPDHARSEFTNSFREEASKSVDLANGLNNEGRIAAAYSDVVWAAMNVYISLEAGRCVQSYNQGGYRGAVSRLRNNEWLELEIQRVAERFRDTEPTTLNQLAMYISACDAFFEAIAFQKLAQRDLASLPAEETEWATVRALDAAGWQIMAWTDCKVALDCLELVEEYEGTPIPDHTPVLEMATFYRRAADANLSAFDAIYVSNQAKRNGQTAEVFARELTTTDPYYALLTNAQTNVVPNLQTYFGDGPQLAYAYLASSLYIYSRSSMLIAKYYSLSAQLDEENQIVSVGRELTFSEWLEQSEQEAARNIALLEDNGVDITTCAQLYEMARVGSTRDLGDRLNALETYFYINVVTRVLRRVGRIPIAKQP
ncbi:MAG: S16 family serine protease [Pirellulaceae bacterium]